MMTLRLDRRVRSPLLVGGLSLLWLVVTFVVVAQPTQPGSPDEAANAFFIDRLSRTGQVAVPTPLTAAENQVFHPRSMVARGDRLLPASFLGFLQVGGLLDRWFGPLAIRFLTPLGALFGLIALYRICRRYWEPVWCLAIVVLVAFHPVFFQFQTLPLFHNGLFVSLLVVSGLCLLRLTERPSVGRAAVFGLIYGASLFFRPSEVLWTGPLVFITILSLRGGWRWCLVSLAVTATVQLPWLWADARLYGSVFASGYTPVGLSDADSGDSSGSVWTIFTPRGGQWTWHFWSSAWWYLVMLLPAWSLATIVSVVLYFKRKLVNWQKVIKLGLVALIAIFFLAYYGSWDLYPHASAGSVGSLASYARYWLSLYVAMGAGVVVFFRRAFGRLSFWPAVILIMMLGSQVVTILDHPRAGLLARWRDSRRIDQEVSTVLAQTNPSSLIVAGQFDKYLYGQRLTMFQLPQTDSQWRMFRAIIAKRPVVIFASPLQYRRSVVDTVLHQAGLRIRREAPVGDSVLWFVEPVVGRQG